MTTFFIIYVIYALVVLVSCSCAAAPPVQYVSISKPTIDSWILSGRCPIILEIRPRRPNDAGFHGWDMPLIVAENELASLVRWLPRASLLIIRSPYAVHSLGREVESVLVDLGISIVYWVPEEATSPLTLPTHR